MAQWDNTNEWKLYQDGIDYNNKLGIYQKNELNWNMYNGQQWIGIKTNGLSKWTFNICRSSINYFIAFICSQKVKMQYSADNISDDPQDEQEIKIKKFTDLMSRMADMKWEKDKMDSKIRTLMLDAANSGDFAAYVYWDASKPTGQNEKGDFVTEIVDGVNVMFGNPNNFNVESQPYILVLGREMVSKLKDEAKANGITQDLIDSITSDQDTQYQSGASGKIELDNKDNNGKCNYVIKFWKKNGKVFWNKSTRYCPIRKDIDLGISRYPIAWGNWETVKNSYHGMPVIEGIIDNQISLNQLFAMVSYWMKMAAFGKVMYDKSKISNWTNSLGTAIGVEGDVTNVVHQLQAGQFNAAVLNVIDMAVKYTKDFIGASDSFLGNIDPNNASGAAIITVAKQASIPLGNIIANRDQFIEDLGLIWGEFFMKKYKNRKVSIKENDKTIVGNYSTEGMGDILLQCKVDVGASSYWSEIVGIQALDKLLTEKNITQLQYFERIQKMNIIPNCTGLIRDAQIAQDQAKAMMEQQQTQIQQIQGQEQQAQQDQQVQESQAQNQKFEAMANFVEQLPEETQNQLKALPPDDMQKQVLQMMKQSVNNSMKEVI